MPLALHRMSLPTLLTGLAFLLLAACGGEQAEGPVEERTYLCGSYESVAPGAVASEPPC
jgi:hypothetical protein